VPFGDVAVSVHRARQHNVPPDHAPHYGTRP
jgi:hypothetical protein